MDTDDKENEFNETKFESFPFPKKRFVYDLMSSRHRVLLTKRKRELDGYD